MHEVWSRSLTLLHSVIAVGAQKGVEECKSAAKRSTMGNWRLQPATPTMHNICQRPRPKTLPSLSPLPSLTPAFPLVLLLLPSLSKLLL